MWNNNLNFNNVGRGAKCPTANDLFMYVYVFKIKLYTAEYFEYCSKSKSDDLGVYTNFVYAGNRRIIS